MPPERVPDTLGETADRDPAFARLPQRPRVRQPGVPPPGAADVPPLARQVVDRAALDDPTAEIAAVRAVFTALPLPATPAWFLRLGIPDPFELAGHLRGKTGSDAELGTKPVNVPPGRP